jgi:predicted AAA+ superfamily ATPase
MDEVGPGRLDALWLRGGFPRSFLARSDQASLEWRLDFLRTFLERDLPQLGVSIPSTTLRRFWTMLAHYHGQVWNASEFARAFGVSDMTVRRYLDLLAATFVVRILQPWHENLSKRQVKAPKIYLRDSGILHSLLSVRTATELSVHPKVGSSWEGFALETVLRLLGTRTEESFFWATQAAAELDLLVFPRGKRIGFEFKRTDAPKVTRSMTIAGDDLKLDHLYVVFPGAKSFPLSSQVTALALPDVPAQIKKLR